MSTLRSNSDRRAALTEVLLVQLKEIYNMPEPHQRVDVLNTNHQDAALLREFSRVFTGSFNQKSEFRRSENMSKPVTKGEKFNVAELSILRELWGNNYAHVILIAEADSLPIDRALYQKQ